MGWMFCGTDRRGRDIGYGIPATCDKEACDAEIDRGLGYACGEMHGEDSYWCDGYYCPDHLYGVTYPAGSIDEGGTVCESCRELIEGLDTHAGGEG